MLFRSRKHHQSPIRLTTKYTSDTLRSVSHRIEPKEFRFSYPIRIPKIFETRLQYSAFRVLIRNSGGIIQSSNPAECCQHSPKHDHSTSIVVIKINPFRHFSSRNGQQHRAPSIIARLEQTLASFYMRQLVQCLPVCSSRALC